MAREPCNRQKAIGPALLRKAADGRARHSHGAEKVWLYGAPRVRDGRAVTLTTRSRNTAGYRQLLEAVAAANPEGDLHVIADNLASHKSPPIWRLV